MNNSDIIIQTILALKKYPKMYLRGDVSYLKIESYLNGYFTALGQLYSVELKKLMGLWFQEKVNQNSSYPFTAHVDFYYKDKSEDERINILIDLVEEFFQENPEWHL
ncbi:MAG: hypothetical protein FWG67_01150 [Defluviitaleaceae bacterium]|nr:hypothetical protein [Defluviitaleaceae bacterium]